MIQELLNELIAAGLSEAEIGREIGRDQSSVNRMRRGKQRPNYETGLRIAQLHLLKCGAGAPVRAISVDTKAAP